MTVKTASHVRKNSSAHSSGSAMKMKPIFQPTAWPSHCCSAAMIITFMKMTTPKKMSNLSLLIWYFSHPDHVMSDVSLMETSDDSMDLSREGPEAASDDSMDGRPPISSPNRSGSSNGCTIMLVPSCMSASRWIPTLELTSASGRGLASCGVAANLGPLEVARLPWLFASEASPLRRSSPFTHSAKRGAWPSLVRSCSVNSMCLSCRLASTFSCCSRATMAWTMSDPSCRAPSSSPEKSSDRPDGLPSSWYAKEGAMEAGSAPTGR
mmetsp:Transcript_36046/g.92859  ORF Transcript_36046/g.92859 Transcript_36046/m.92859 type:complete len:266 (+) Transcript_36046:1026-1823(+)